MVFYLWLHSVRTRSQHEHIATRAHIYGSKSFLPKNSPRRRRKDHYTNLRLRFLHNLTMHCCLFTSIPLKVCNRLRCLWNCWNGNVHANTQWYISHHQAPSTGNSKQNKMKEAPRKCCEHRKANDSHTSIGASPVTSAAISNECNRTNRLSKWSIANIVTASNKVLCAVRYHITHTDRYVLRKCRHTHTQTKYSFLRLLFSHALYATPEPRQTKSD